MDSSGCGRHSRLSPSKRRRLSSSCTTTQGSTNGLLSGRARNGLCGCIFKGLRACSTDTSSVPVPLSSRFSDLTDDVLLDILLRLPAKSLHRFKSVSKRWFSLISAPSFARSHILRRLSNEINPTLPDDDPAARDINRILFLKIQSFSSRISSGQIFGLPLLYDDMNKVSSSMSGLLPPLSFHFIPELRPHHYDYIRGLSSKGVTERVLVGMDLKGNCTGLVLLQACFQDRTDAIPYYENLRYYIYYVCNPITKHWVKLPSISTLDLIGLTCYYVQQGEGGIKEMTRIWVDTGSSGNDIKQIANYDPNRIEYTVISINREEQDDVFVIRVFSSTDETAEWRIFRVPFPHGYKLENTYGRHKVLFSNGKFHWTGGTCIVAYDPFNKPDECDIIPLPPTDPPIEDSTYMFIATYEGRIRVGTPLWTKRFSVWELADYANKLWVNKSEVNVDFNGFVHVQSFVGGAAPGDKAYVVADKPKNTIMVFDLKNASLQHVYTYPIKEDDYYYYSRFSMMYSESYFSLRWPTVVPQLQRK